ncbi:MAG: 50S ribosomal protein L13 [Patescibacteria group bacterium]
MRKPTPPTTTITLDADGKVLGRFASLVAYTLLGKGTPSYRPDVISGEKVIITNASKIRVTGTKLLTKKYAHFSGYPGGLRETILRDKLAQDPTSVLITAIKRMLPQNRTRKFILKRLVVKA